MVLDLPGGLFGQDDVRETETGLPSGTSYWTAPGSAWLPNTESIDFSKSGGILINNVNGQNYTLPIDLPDGAIVTAVICLGNAGATAETWTMQRHPLDAETAETMATAAFDTEDTTISFATIDNTAYSYTISSSTIDTGDRLYGIRIIYTT